MEHYYPPAAPRPTPGLPDPAYGATDSWFSAELESTIGGWTNEHTAKVLNGVWLMVLLILMSVWIPLGVLLWRAAL